MDVLRCLTTSRSASTHFYVEVAIAFDEKFYQQYVCKLFNPTFRPLKCHNREL